MLSTVCCSLSPPDIHFPHHQSKISDRNPLLMHTVCRRLVSAPSIWQIGTLQTLHAQVDVIHRSVFIQMLEAVISEEQVLLSPLPHLVCACYKPRRQRSTYNRRIFFFLDLAEGHGRAFFLMSGCHYRNLELQCLGHSYFPALFKNRTMVTWPNRQRLFCDWGWFISVSSIQHVTVLSINFSIYCTQIYLIIPLLFFFYIQIFPVFHNKKNNEEKSDKSFTFFSL